jgi:DNA polymerase-3 subunit gamma/tau
LQYVSYQENIDLDDSAARVIARLADGGMRDGLSLLDQCASATVGELTAEQVYACLGIAGEQKCGELMGYIAAHDTRRALELFNRLYSEGKDLSAMLDEMACLTRDLLVMKTASGAGITMLSGVASDKEVLELTKALTSGELVRMMNLIQSTLAGFTRSASRRMDAELCILELCQPELSLDVKAMNARITRLEEQLKSGTFVAAKTLSEQPQVEPADPDDDRPPFPDDGDAPPQEPVVMEDPTPMGFWPELVAAVRRELKPPVVGFFVVTANAPVQGRLVSGGLELLCNNRFVADSMGRAEVLEVVTRKASAQLGQEYTPTGELVPFARPISRTHPLLRSAFWGMVAVLIALSLSYVIEEIAFTAAGATFSASDIPILLIYWLLLFAIPCVGGYFLAVYFMPFAKWLEERNEKKVPIAEDPNESELTKNDEE